MELGALPQEQHAAAVAELRSVKHGGAAAAVQRPQLQKARGVGARMPEQYEGALAAAQRFEFAWMWADAGLVPILGHALAEANPWRWESGSADKVMQRLREKGRAASKHKNRKVQLRYRRGAGGWSRSHLAWDPEAAVEWIRKITKTTEP
jgi:hypothetical protein